jgi:hypothetical protein
MYAKSDMLGSILDIRHDRTGSARQDWQSTIGSYDHLWLLTWLTSVFFRLKVALDFGDNASLSPTFSRELCRRSAVHFLVNIQASEITRRPSMPL